MTELPYRFHTPIPRYFDDVGWLNPNKATHLNTLAFLFWSFKRCNLDQRIVCWDNKELELEPFEFICGRVKCSEEMGLTEDELRTQIKIFVKAGLLEKTPNSVPYRFNCYKWITSRFPKMHPQENPQLIPDQSPREPHKRDEETNRLKDVKDVSLGGCGNVHNLEDLIKFFAEYKFKNDTSIKPVTLLRWLKTYPQEEIYKSLCYYEKMDLKKEIPKPEAYVEATLQKRFWESDQMRSECLQREAEHRKQKENFSKDFM